MRFVTDNAFHPVEGVVGLFVCAKLQVSVPSFLCLCLSERMASPSGTFPLSFEPFVAQANVPTSLTNTRAVFHVPHLKNASGGETF